MYKKIGLGLLASTAIIVAGVLFAQNEDDTHEQSLHCQHVPEDCETSVERITSGSSSIAKHSIEIETPISEPGQGMFGALSEINSVLEASNTDWSSVDMDGLWDHLRDMDALMTGTIVEKTLLDNGIKMKVSGTGSSKKAMDNMLPTHADFLRSVRPNWEILLSTVGESYEVIVTSDLESETIRIQALGFSGFMVQDDHHASHHYGLAVGSQVH